MRDSNGRFVKGNKLGFKKGNKWGTLTKGKVLSKETKEKISKSRKGKATKEKNPRWNGGKTIDKDGYIRILSLNHPNKTVRGYVLQHRLVMEKKIGRYLKPEEDVHHIDQNRQNNSPNNLMLFANREEHTKFHKERGIQI